MPCWTMISIRSKAVAEQDAEKRRAREFCSQGVGGRPGARVGTVIDGDSLFPTETRCLDDPTDPARPRLFPKRITPIVLHGPVC
jgi:hypothetical protein